MFFFFKILNFFNFFVYSCTFLATKHSQTIHQFENPNQNKKGGDNNNCILHEHSLPIKSFDGIKR